MLRPTITTLFPYTTLFRSWLDYQQRVHPRGVELGLDRVRDVFEALGRPRPAPVVITVAGTNGKRSEEHTSELQSRRDLVCRLLLEKKNLSHVNLFQAIELY